MAILHRIYWANRKLKDQIANFNSCLSKIQPTMEVAVVVVM
jgi:hypothetical protein